ncbi:MAG: DMT family transporter [Candidatus Thorarchaeota archaeon]
MGVSIEIIIGAAAGLLSAFLYAVSVVIYRSQAEEAHPLVVSALKMWVALIFMVIIAILPLGADPLSVPLPAVVILSGSIVLGAVVGDTVYLASQERIGVTYAFPISMTYPVLTFVITIVFLGEPLIAARIIGAVIAVAGGAVLAMEQNRYNGDTDCTTPRNVIGILLAVLTAVFYAVATVLIQVGLRGYDVDAVTANLIRVGFGSAIFVPIFAAARHQGVRVPSLHSAKRIAIAAVFGMGLGTLLYVFSIQYAGAAISSVVASTAPLFATPISIHYLRETPTMRTGIGVLATVIGVLLVVLG